MPIPASPIDHAYVALAGRYIGRIAKEADADTGVVVW